MATGEENSNHNDDQTDKNPIYYSLAVVHNYILHQKRDKL
tara:strand:+ start:421 stop:540 length:120 start_codon:yes stop_codon:yes gene_type:complete